MELGNLPKELLLRARLVLGILPRLGQLLINALELLTRLKLMNSASPELLILILIRRTRLKMMTRVKLLVNRLRLAWRKLVHMDNILLTLIVLLLYTVKLWLSREGLWQNSMKILIT